MREQHVYLPQYDWKVDLLHDARPCDADYILDKLWGMGCAEWHLHRAEELLRSGRTNQGLTYSDKFNRHTVIVVGRADNIGQYISTLVHECDHLADHISQYYGIPYDSEENSYLLGAIAEAICNDAMKYAVRRYARYLLHT